MHENFAVDRLMKGSIKKDALGLQYYDCLKYIDKYWKKITFHRTRDSQRHIGLPNPFVSPNPEIFRHDQFYWDSYFTILGLVVSGRLALAKGMVDNLMFLFKKYKIIPLRNRAYNLGISQPPFLTSMAREVLNYKNDKRWLKKVTRVSEDELLNYWMSDAGQPDCNLIYQGLSRYCDHFISHGTSEHESGWDSTSRFDDRCLNFLPVDLNSCLYKYEADLEYFYSVLGNKRKATKFRKQAEARKKTIMKLLWDPKRNFFFDYDYRNRKRSTFYSIAGFYPLWAGLASKPIAKRMLKALKKFEHRGGLATTQSTGLSKEYRQWDFPNGWPNQHWIVINGLLRYGLKEEAERIALKWLKLNKKVFKQTGKIWEKYDVVKMQKGQDGRYVTQSGFGWTNAVFVRLIHDLENN